MSAFGVIVFTGDAERRKHGDVRESGIVGDGIEADSREVCSRAALPIRKRRADPRVGQDLARDATIPHHLRTNALTRPIGRTPPSDDKKEDGPRCGERDRPPFVSATSRESVECALAADWIAPLVWRPCVPKTE